MKIKFLLLLGALFGVLFFYYNHSSYKFNLSDYILLEKTIEGDSMSPMLKNGQKIDLVIGYYKDNAAKVGEVVAFNYGGNKHMMIKIIKATSKEKLDIEKDYLFINGEVMKNSIGENYHFSHSELKLLGLYIKNGHIPEGSYFIFGDNITDSVDSRKFGAVSKDDMFGKFFIK